MLIERPLVCLDVETTGASPQHDRITEIGIVQIHADGRTEEWSTPVNPECRIPEFIERLTGISNAMVQDAPRFADIADVLAEKLQGRVFVAHNARFDYAFIKNEYRRIERDFRADTLCTVRLSRRLYPQHYKHNLDSLIQRLGLVMEARHRALADARVLAVFLQRITAELPPEQVRDAVKHVMKKPALPPHLPDGVVDDLPDAPGVYRFYGDNDLPLYVGKSINLRDRVLSHFAGDHGSTKELSISRQLKRIEWTETAGDLGAQLLEAQQIKALQPIHNQRLRRENDLCTWQLADAEQGGKTLLLRYAADIDFGRARDLYGTFTSQRKAIEALRDLASAHRLCHIQLGLEKRRRGKASPCFGYQLSTCKGVCIGKENPLQHDIRLLEALSRLKLTSWPWPGAVGVRETRGAQEAIHVVDHWVYLGTAHNQAEVQELLEQPRRAVFDLDTYKILVRHLKDHTDVMPLAALLEQ